MKLLKYLEATREEDITPKSLELLINPLRSRMFTLEMQEPDSCGVVYEKWQEKVDELDSIIQLILDDIEQLEETIKDKDKIDSLKELQKEILDELQDEVIGYQIWYGGLGKLNLE